MTDTSPPSTDRATADRRLLVPLAAGIGALGMCCGLPVLASLGVTGLVAGVGAGSWLAVAVASFVVVIGVLRWRHQRTCLAPRGTTSSSHVTPEPVFTQSPQQEAQ